ncbi:MFS transporter [Dactylosporangium sp. CA-092794]|uniref:MFS transporter n=1 Tax=Dactylosporangium sp. CA-092794 TaxID=3239929 RepID=UPI003D91C0F2
MTPAPDPRHGTIIAVYGDIPLPVEVRNDRLDLVTTGSVGHPISLPPGRYAISVPIPSGPLFRTVVEVEPDKPGTVQVPLNGLSVDDTARPMTAYEAAVAFVEHNRLDAALHVLRNSLPDLPPAGVALAGFVALRLNDVKLAKRIARTMPASSPDCLALRATLRRAADDIAEAGRLAGKALALGLPDLTPAALALVAALRDSERPDTPQSQALVRLVRAANLHRVALARPEPGTPEHSLVWQAWPRATDTPPTFRQTLANTEYRAIFTAWTLSTFGSYAARVVIMAMVYDQTHNPLVTTAAFAATYLPWLGFGQVLTTWAERFPPRRTIVVSDLVRAAAMLPLVIFSNVPYGLTIALVFVSALLASPADAARSSLLPQILKGDRHLVGLSLQRASGQATLVAGYVMGAALAAVSSSLGLLLTLATFGISALLIALWVRERPSSSSNRSLSTLIRDYSQGSTIVFRSAVLRTIALVVFFGVGIAVIPEGLAAAWAAELAGHSSPLYMGAIMTAAAVGFVAGAFATSLIAPGWRILLARPLAVVAVAALVPSLFSPGILTVVGMTLISGVALSLVLPTTNGLFVRVLPTQYRVPAFQVMQSGVHLSQGTGVLVVGWLATWWRPLPEVVGCFAVAGAAGMVVLALMWPSSAADVSAVEENRLNAQEPEPAAKRPAPASGGHEHPEEPAGLDDPFHALDSEWLDMLLAR